MSTTQFTEVAMFISASSHQRRFLKAASVITIVLVFVLSNLIFHYHVVSRTTHGPNLEPLMLGPVQYRYGKFRRAPSKSKAKSNLVYTLLGNNTSYQEYIWSSISQARNLNTLVPIYVIL